MKLAEYLDGLGAAISAAELDVAIRAPFKHRFRGPTWSRICKVRIEAGQRICRAHPNGRFVPFVGDRRLLTVCDQTYRVGYGQNGPGESWVWTSARNWARGVLEESGFTKRAAYRVWENSCGGYPHRALAIVEEALAGKLPDPRFDRLIYRGLSSTGNAVRVDDRDDEAKDRAHRPCKCGGWLWDWGSGWCGYADFISWRCDRCPRMYTEYLSPGRLYQIRNRTQASPAPTEAASP